MEKISMEEKKGFNKANQTEENGPKKFFAHFGL